MLRQYIIDITKVDRMIESCQLQYVITQWGLVWELI